MSDARRVRKRRWLQVLRIVGIVLALAGAAMTVAAFFILGSGALGELATLITMLLVGVSLVVASTALLRQR